ncbi:HIT family protein [Actinoplanes hulinensis]|uniref:HIT family protein n=1 Tax=Actinoplanes hulinensis TaxID=1144547 RepID=A0ABS7B4B6_9ACTN|nr:HIT family protein [Actinoplanes hulinensis]
MEVGVFNHEPDGYACPFCRLVAGGDDPRDPGAQRAVVHRGELATAVISPRWWPKNPGHVLVVPNAHHENLYDLPARDGHAVHDLVREIAIALKKGYGCDGTSVRQHNEPAGNQDVWHYHVHVLPRYDGDDLYRARPLPDFMTAEHREPYAARLRPHLESRA